MPNPFINPWKDLSREDLLKTTVDVSRDTMSKISRVHSKQGVLQTTIYLLITKLTHELELHGITEYDPAAYERGVAGCRLILDLPGRSTIAVPATEQLSDRPAEAVSGNDGPRTAELAPAPAGPSAAPDTNVAPSKRSGKRVKGEKGTDKTKGRK